MSIKIKIIFTIVLWIGLSAYAEILSTKPESPFSLPLDRLQQLNLDNQEKANKELQQLVELEHDLEREKSQMDPSNRGVLEFVQDIMGQFEQLSPEMKTAILQEGSTDIVGTTQDRAIVAEMWQRADTAKQLSKEFVGNLDNYIQRTIDYSIFLTLQLASETIVQMLQSNEIKPTQKESMQAIYDKMIQSIYGEKGYLENKREYGQAKDATRIVPYNRFMDLSEEFFEKAIVNASAKTKTSLSQKAQGIINSFKALPKFLAVVPNIAGVLSSIVFGVQPKGDKAPLMGNVNEVVRKIAKAKGMKVSVIGDENIPRSQDSKTITLYTPSHRDALKDMMAFAHLGVDGVVPFAAAGNFLPGEIKIPFTRKKLDVTKIKTYLIKRLNLNKGLIVVGNKNNPNPIDPIEKLLQIVESSDIRDFLIYPEGRLPDALGSAGPMREKFFSADGPIAKLEALGYKVNLVPVTMRLNFLPNETSDHVEVKVYPTLDDRTRRVITALGGSEGLALLYRFGLVSDLITDKELLWGQLRATQLKQEFKDRFRINNSNNEMCLQAYR